MPGISKKLRPEKRPEPQSESAYYLSQWQGRGMLVGIPCPNETHITVPPKLREEQRPIKESPRVLAERLCAKHPAISTDPEILGGTPHIKGTRLSVRTIMGKLHLYGNVQTILDIYEPHLSEEQVKEAIAYAQDFLEIGCVPNEP